MNYTKGDGRRLYICRFNAIDCGGDDAFIRENGIRLEVLLVSYQGHTFALTQGSYVPATREMGLQSRVSPG